MDKYGNPRVTTGRCRPLPFAEDNVRFVLLAIVLLIYMLVGATIFQYLESDFEVRQTLGFWQVYTDFRQHYVDLVSCQNSTEPSLRVLDRLHSLLYAYGNASALGIIHKRRRWDFAGSFHFVGTIVSTIGYGNTVPQTVAGKIMVIVYGFLGCSGGILFFNLFLERIITFLACILRLFHLRRMRTRWRTANTTSRRVSRMSRGSLPDILDDDDADLEHWKPSVYWVMIALGLAACVVASCAAAIYSPFENWTYFDAIYFCFVSFATIGFGDFVSTDRLSYPHIYIYRATNFVFLIIGCCCIYSLLNVTSIVIKQFLNWIIMRMECRCFEDPTSTTAKLWRRHSQMLNSRQRRRRRSSGNLPISIRRARRSKIITVMGNSNTSFGKGIRRDSGSSGNESGDTDRNRKLSGELISIKDFLQANKVSLAVMQKQLYETAQMQRGGNHTHNQVCNSRYTRRFPSTEFTPGQVGPLAIASNKLGDNNCR